MEATQTSPLMTKAEFNYLSAISKQSTLIDNLNDKNTSLTKSLDEKNNRLQSAEIEISKLRNELRQKDELLRDTENTVRSYKPFVNRVDDLTREINELNKRNEYAMELKKLMITRLEKNIKILNDNIVELEKQLEEYEQQEEDADEKEEDAEEQEEDLEEKVDEAKVYEKFEMPDADDELEELDAKQAIKPLPAPTVIELAEQQILNALKAGNGRVDEAVLENMKVGFFDKRKSTHLFLVGNIVLKRNFLNPSYSLKK